MANNLLAAADVFRTIGSVALAILILLVMITIHEFGHYLAGKIFGFRINEFSIGFGPALFKHTSKKTGELFAVRLVPLGGYCAFAGEDGLEEEEKIPEGKDAEPASEASSDKAPESSEPSGSSEPPKDDRSGYFTNRPCWQRIIVLIAGAAMNYLLALVLIMIGMFAYGQRVVEVRGVAGTENELEALHSFHTGDLLLRADGKAITMSGDVPLLLNGKKAGEEVIFLVAEEGKTPVERSVILREDVNVKSSSDTSVWRALGVGIEERDGAKYYMLGDGNYRLGFFETLGGSFVYSFKIAGSIFRVLGELLTGKLGLSAVGGPVTTITMTSQIVSQGFRYFLEIAGYIGVNLAVFNLLPIPALDGSKVIFTAIEWVRGKPISRKVEAIIHAVGFVLLLGFAVLVDILQFV